MSFEQKLYTLLQPHLQQFRTLKQIWSIVGVQSKFDKQNIADALDSLVKAGKLQQDGARKSYKLLDTEGLISGTIEGNQRGFAFVLRDDGQDDLFVPPSKLNGALHRDKVLVRPIPNTQDEAEVVVITQRGMSSIVGTVDKKSAVAFVIPDERKFYKDIYIAKDNQLNAKNGQKVVVNITYYPMDSDKHPEGKIVQILGYQGEHDADMLSVAYSFGIADNFPDSVTKRAGKLPQQVTDSDLIGRLDLRNIQTFTIDGDDAKDLDDAVSIVNNGDGTYTLGVHIADVSHYVKPNDDIDKEAFKRGTSVYFPYMVFPMLPTELSNGICSLYEKVDRLTLSCIMTIDSQGNVTEYQVAPSVIHSCHRMTYNNVQAILDGDKSLCEEYSDILQPLLDMQQLANILMDKRKRRGTIDFESKEVKFILDEQGEVTDIVHYERKFAHRLIEEFMIIANETVAQYASDCEVPFVYRTHEKPDPDKLQVLYALMQGVGVKVKQSQTVHVSILANALQQVENTQYYNLVNDVMLRTMQKAKYTTTNIGHFGLSSNCYCHFTSPIRRYPDLTVHRVLKTLVAGKMTEKALNAYSQICQDVSTQSSQTERNADEAERKAVDIKKCRYAMRNMLHHTYQGIISGVTERGFFVELDNTVEGFVDVNSLPQYGFVFDEKKFCLSNGNITYSLGDVVTVTITNVNITTCKIDMALESNHDNAGVSQE